MVIVTTQENVRFDRHTPWNPLPPQLHDTQDVNDESAARNPVYCCVQCLHPVTDRDAHIEMAGSHLHVFTNPGGFTYELALYAYANCIVYGESTKEYTWFSGYAWQLALCANCQEHLGWRYLKTDSAAFYGLIWERLIEVNT